ncbi:MAG TPA: marine proteobacterial sortase target protein [Trueperaceae bacterium]|nr:marine proteobacterial sortase target protein [Trueperaceae bacterium]
MYKLQKLRNQKSSFKNFERFNIFKYLNPLEIILIPLLLFSLTRAEEAPSALVNIDDISSGELVFYTDTVGEFLPATKLSTVVDMKISGMVSRVNLKQSFINTGNDWTEALYVFPLPEDAAVDSLKMIIGDRIIVGEIQEKQQAKETYERAKEAGYQTSLVEQERPNMFTTSVANIAPGQTIIIEISYIETLSLTDNSFSMRFPLAITPRYIPGAKLVGEENINYQNTGNGWAANTDQVPDASKITPYYSDAIKNPVKMHIELDAGFPLELLESRYHDVKILQTDNTYSIDLDTNPSNKDFELVWTPKLGSEPGAAVFSENLDGEAYALVMLVPPKLENIQSTIAREMIFIIDTSGSMSGTSMRQAKDSLELALNRLNSRDKFNIVEFNSTASELFGQSQKANARNIARAHQFVKSLQADGGTEMVPALNLALKNRTDDSFLRQVVFITDGSVGNETELFQLIERKLKDANLFTVAIGSAPNSYFMRKAAEFGRGSFVYISDVAEVKEKMAKLFEKLEKPVLTNVDLKLPQGSEVYPKIVPNLYAGEPVVLSIKLARADGEVRISGNIADKTWSRSVNLANAASGEVAQVWARAKIESLNDEMIRGGDYSKLEKDITELALKHHLITDYTSLVAVDKTPARPAQEDLTTEDLPLEVPDGQTVAQEMIVSEEVDAIDGSLSLKTASPSAPNAPMPMANSVSIGNSNQALGYPNTATPAQLNLLISLLCFLLAFALFLKRRQIRTKQ